MSKQELKQALISLAIGTAISLITLLAQYAVAWLQTVPAELPGSAAGMISYLWKVRHFV